MIVFLYLLRHSNNDNNNNKYTACALSEDNFFGVFDCWLFQCFCHVVKK